jgi:hypothetical protein
MVASSMTLLRKVWRDQRCNQNPYSGSEYIYPSVAPGFTPVFIWTPFTRPLALYICFVDHCFSFCTFSFRHCDVLVLRINWKFTIGKLISSLVSYSCVLYRPSLSISRCTSRYEPDLQEFLLAKVKSSLRKCYDYHHDLVDPYGIAVSQWQPICPTYRKHLTVFYLFENSLLLN